MYYKQPDFDDLNAQNRRDTYYGRTLSPVNRLDTNLLSESANEFADKTKLVDTGHSNSGKDSIVIFQH